MWKGILLGKRCTIYDIARCAGVSTKTVSKVLNDKSGVGPETRQRIQRLIREMGYHPHYGARALRGQRRNCVGVTVAPPLEVVPLSQDFLLWLFAKLSEVFSSQGAYLAFDMAPRIGETGVSDYGRGVWERMYDVCLVVGPLPVGDSVVQRIHATGIPYLALGRADSFAEGNSATVDFQAGAYMSTRFLLERGHRRIGLLASFEGYQAGLDRVRGYQRALREFGVAADEAAICYYDPMQDNLRSLAEEVMRLQGLTALVDSSACEDSEALRQSAAAAGRKIGDDLECVVWTYMKDAAVLSEASAHLWVPVREAAVEGIDQLAGLAAGETRGPIKINYTPVLTDADHLFEVRKPMRIVDLL